MLLLRLIAAICGVGLLVPGAGVVYGQDYPSKTIRIITTGAGGGSDFVTRLLAQGISGPLGQPVIVDNRTILISGEAASRAPPDGYTLLLVSSTLWIATLLQKTPYDPVADFAPISTTTRAPNMLVVHPSLPAKSVQELIGLSKARPGVLNYASGPIGGSSHLAAELFKFLAGVNIAHIAYKSTGIAVNEVTGGHVELMFSSIGPVIPHVKSGRLRALALTSAAPSPLLPGLQTVAATGLPGYESESLDGLFAPAKTPAAIINRLNQEVVRVLNQPDVKEKLLNSGAEAVGNSPEQFAAYMKTDIARTSKVIKVANIKVE